MIFDFEDYLPWLGLFLSLRVRPAGDTRISLHHRETQPTYPILGFLNLYQQAIAFEVYHFVISSWLITVNY